MIADIIATGDEIRTGALVDRNSAYIADKLEDLGIVVSRHVCVGDDLAQMQAVLRETSARADIAIVTGGLGPTVDDLTAQAAAEAKGVELRLDQAALATMTAFFKKRDFLGFFIGLFLKMWNYLFAYEVNGFSDIGSYR